MLFDFPIEHFDHAAGGDQEVRGFQIAMDDPFVVGIFAKVI